LTLLLSRANYSKCLLLFVSCRFYSCGLWWCSHFSERFNCYLPYLYC